MKIKLFVLAVLAAVVATSTAFGQVSGALSSAAAGVASNNLGGNVGNFGSNISSQISSGTGWFSAPNAANPSLGTYPPIGGGNSQFNAGVDFATGVQYSVPMPGYGVNGTGSYGAYGVGNTGFVANSGFVRNSAFTSNNGLTQDSSASRSNTGVQASFGTRGGVSNAMADYFGPNAQGARLSSHAPDNGGYLYGYSPPHYVPGGPPFNAKVVASGTPRSYTGSQAAER